ncbi:Serine/threonine protein kinase [Geodermatophilus siccatus]|uniref:non-specific serine/threonine protein kinase n=1 Tax=Geodermatophilus siccatus TaxID=1137991 RepID=A0A1G9QA16_9ACTN|nr:serine/threonine-protein kinase [Geodermatophilus siccatus]SDM07571.1 Serine/threonine protein kinase [Geodermatophilus siccatus]
MRPQPALLDPGTSFAHYRVDSVIGRGGMGVVYLAHDVRLDRKVALKLLAPEYTSHENFRARFLRESRLAAAVDHPNIIPIYEAGDAEGQLFLAMRYVPGSDLRTELDRRTRLPLPEALDLLHQVADALDAAHAAGLVHRDVKPGNVLVDERSRQGHRHAYLTDFGLTRRSTSISGLTTSGHFLGTLDYVAPEQIRGDPVDGRADVYSFACVAYAVLAGRPPFDGEDDVALMWAHLSRVPPRAATLLPELAGGVDEALAAGLAKSPEDRPATCGALVALMEAGTPSGPPAPSPSQGPPGPPPGDEDPSHPGAVDDAPRPRSRRGWAAALAVVAALVAVAVVVGLLAFRGRGEELTTFAAEDIPYTLEVPADWVARTHEAGASSVTVLSPTDLTALFADDPAGVPSAAAAVDADPAAVVGLAIYHRPRLDGDSPVAQLPAAQALLPGRDADLRPGEREAVGDLEASAMSGTLGLGDDASLQVRVLALDSSPRQLLVFFAPPSVFAERVDTFDRVAGSLDGTG